MNIDDRITALAPLPKQPDQEWAEATLTRILAEEQPRPRRRARRRLATLAVAGLLVAGSGTAFAMAGADPIDSVKDALLGTQGQPNMAGNDVGTINDPQLVAQFPRSDGAVFAVWIATTSSGAVCFAYSDADWDGTGTPTHLEYGCDANIVDPANPDRIIPLERPDQWGGFFKDVGGPILYGVSPFPDAVAVRVAGLGVQRTLPVRADSLGYGSTLPGAGRAKALTLTFLDSAGHAVGTRTVVAPVG